VFSSIILAKLGKISVIFKKSCIKNHLISSMFNTSVGAGAASCFVAFLILDHKNNAQKLLAFSVFPFLKARDLFRAQ
jgi:hypothetical protein